MFRSGMMAVLAAAMLVPAAAEAQRERGSVTVRRAPMEDMVRVLTNRRVRLGVNVDLQAGASDTIGARLEGVTPGGPADKAGLRAGDVITHLDGQALYSGDAESRNERRSLPGMRLIELAAQLEPNDTVTVQYRRDNDRRTASLVTAGDEGNFIYRAEPGSFVFRGPEGPRGMSLNDAPVALWRFGSPLGQLELAPINADLGQYFGVTEGVLVIDAPDDSELKLKGGDVVLSVDGRKPNGPQHLLRILRSYEPGEEVRLEIQRNRRRETVSARIESGNRMELAPTREKVRLAPSKR